MEIEIATIGGYEEVGRQMTAVRAGDDIVVFDMGLNLSNVLIHDNVQTEKLHSLDLIDDILNVLRNPFDRYEYPSPPMENWLDASVDAGEENYH